MFRFSSEHAALTPDGEVGGQENCRGADQYEVVAQPTNELRKVLEVSLPEEELFSAEPEKPEFYEKWNLRAAAAAAKAAATPVGAGVLS